jgi:hypothetical protein
MRVLKKDSVFWWFAPLERREALVALETERLVLLRRASVSAVGTAVMLSSFPVWDLDE